MRKTWKDDLQNYLLFMGDRVDHVYVTPEQAKMLAGIKKADPLPPEEYLPRYMGKRIKIHRDVE